MPKRISKIFYPLSGVLLGALLLLTIGCTETSTTSSPPTAQLVIKKTPLTVNGKTTEVFRIEQPDGAWGYEGVEGEYFTVEVNNTTTEPTILHWHGLILPNNQDGVPDVTQPVIPPGGKYAYRFKLMQSGTYWMHSHYQSQIQQLMSAPLIIHPREKTPTEAQEQNVILLLTDFSFKEPEVIWKELRAQRMQPMEKTMPADSTSSMRPLAADLTEVQYDALLTNYRSLADPEVVQVLPGQTIRLRIIDGAASTNFRIDLGALTGELIAVDGEPIEPLTGSIFEIAMGQRLDIRMTLPAKEKGVYPILAQGEGTRLQTGLILATPDTPIPPFAETTPQAADALSLEQEKKLVPLSSLPNKPVDQRLTLTLEGNMQTYAWTLNGKVWPDYLPLTVKEGERVELIFRNTSTMSHPMHLHGHVFQVTEIDGQPFQGARRDTLLIPAEGTIKVQLDALYPGNWLIHCHVLYHAEGGMMTLLNYEKVPLPQKPITSEMP